MGLIDGHDFEAAKCLDLLRRNRHGHLGLSIQALPVVVPVRYAVANAGLVIGVDQNQLASAIDRAVIALHSEGFDEDVRKRWSVLAIGTTRPIGAEEMGPGWLDVGSGIDAVRDAAHLFHFEPKMLSGGWL